MSVADIQQSTASNDAQAGDGDNSYLSNYNIAVVVPAYNESSHIAEVLETIPTYVRWIIVVDDKSTDDTANCIEEVAADSPRVLLVQHENNQGVGGAMVSGYRKALELNADIVVKMDGDGQMPASFIPALVQPLVFEQADYAKGNRFRDFQALAHMPTIRRAGNMVLSFMTKAAVGYWDCFDPCNGFVAIRGDVLRQLPLDKIDRSFFFETSMLARLYLLDAVVQDVPMPAIYGDEKSHLSVSRVLLGFPPRMLKNFVRRILLKNFLYDFSMESVYLLTGVFIFLAGVLFGGVQWFQYGSVGVSAPTGTVVIPAMAIILGFQLLLSAINEDIRSVPRHPLCRNGLDFSALNHTNAAKSKSAQREMSSVSP